MSIQMDTWIDTTSYAQWKKGCKRKLSKSKQGSKKPNDSNGFV